MATFLNIFSLRFWRFTMIFWHLRIDRRKSHVRSTFWFIQWLFHWLWYTLCRLLDSKRGLCSFGSTTAVKMATIGDACMQWSSTDAASGECESSPSSIFSPPQSPKTSGGCGPKHKLITEGDIQVCRLNHTRTIVSKIMNSKYLRRWESHKLVLDHSELRSTSVCMRIYKGSVFVMPLPRWEFSHTTCLQCLVSVRSSVGLCLVWTRRIHPYVYILWDFHNSVLFYLITASNSSWNEKHSISVENLFPWSVIVLIRIKNSVVICWRFLSL